MPENLRLVQIEKNQCESNVLNKNEYELNGVGSMSENFEGTNGGIIIMASHRIKKRH